MGRKDVKLIKDINQYIGAWVAAGVAIGGILFEVIRSVVTSVANFKISKSNNETKIKLSELHSQQETAQRIAAERQHIRQAFDDYCGYTAALINSEGKLCVNDQAAAFGKVILYLKGPQSNVSFIQSEINKGNYENAMNNFENIVPNLREEEMSLLSQLKQQSPKDCRDD